jgi:hypothetical protein
VKEQHIASFYLSWLFINDVSGSFASWPLTLTAAKQVPIHQLCKIFSFHGE